MKGDFDKFDWTLFLISIENRDETCEIDIEVIY